jgi:hypothetical protein
MSVVLITKFDEDTQKDFCSSDKKWLGSSHVIKKNVKAGVAIAFVNKAGIWAVGELADCPGTKSPCRPRNDQDVDVYQGENAAYNAYKICLKSVNILSKPVDFETVRMAIGATDEKQKTNIWKYGNCRSFSEAFIGKLGEEPETIQRYNAYIHALLKTPPQAIKKIKIKSKVPASAATASAAAATASAAAPPKKSVWLSIRNRPQESKTLPIVWEHIEDISDDEEDTPEDAEERFYLIEESKARLNRRIYENKVDELQGAGLFLSWAEEKPLEMHPNQLFIDGQEYILTWVDILPINK